MSNLYDCVHGESFLPFWSGFELAISKLPDGVISNHCPAAREGKVYLISKVHMQCNDYASGMFLTNVSW